MIESASRSMVGCSAAFWIGLSVAARGIAPASPQFAKLLYGESDPRGNVSSWHSLRSMSLDMCVVTFTVYCVLCCHWTTAVHGHCVQYVGEEPPLKVPSCILHADGLNLHLCWITWNPPPVVFCLCVSTRTDILYDLCIVHR